MDSKKRKKTIRLFRFDEPDAAFELLETESGEPKMFGGGEDLPPSQETRQRPVSKELDDNLNRLKEEYRSDINPDVIFRVFRMGNKVRSAAVFITGMASSDQIADFILKPSMAAEAPREGEDLLRYALERALAMQETELTGKWSLVKQAISEGRTALFLDGADQAILMDTRGFPQRNVSEPTNETVVLGPKEAFTENIRTNVTLVRRIIKTDDLVAEFRAVGGANQTRLAILYREGIANPSLVNEVKRRLAKIDTRMVLASGVVEQLIETHPFSPLPQTLQTERPDRVAAHLMQGHAAILVEGCPLALVAPATLFTLLSSAEDSYQRQPAGTIIRLIRYTGALLSVMMPGYFIALAMHHQGMLSNEVLSTVIASRSMVFLPLPIELLFLLVVFQLIREAGLSVPNALGQSIGIIGGLVLGQAAVSANIVSTVVLILVALTGLGNFTVPDYSTQQAAGYLRIGMVLAAWLGGLLGMFTLTLLITALLSRMKSYGVPFMTPVSPVTNRRGPSVLRGPITNHRRADDWTNTIGRQP